MCPSPTCTYDGLVAAHPPLEAVASSASEHGPGPRDPGGVAVRAVVAPRGHLAWALMALGLAAVGLAAPASAQGLDEGRRLYNEADFRGARAALEAVLASSSVGRAELAEAHALLSSLSHMAGDGREAEEHAEAALALEPDARPPPGASEVLVSLFEEIRDRRRGEAAELRIETSESPTIGRPLRVVLELRAAPDGLVAELTLRCSPGGEEVFEGEGPPPSLEVTAVPRAAELRCHGEGTSPRGASLLTSSVELTAQAAEEVSDDTTPECAVEGAGPGCSPVGVEDSGERERPISPWVWVGVGGGAALLAVAAVVLTVVFWPQEATIDETLVRW